MLSSSVITGGHAKTTTSEAEWLAYIDPSGTVKIRKITYHTPCVALFRADVLHNTSAGHTHSTQHNQNGWGGRSRHDIYIPVPVPSLGVCHSPPFFEKIGEDIRGEGVLSSVGSLFSCGTFYEYYNNTRINNIFHYFSYRILCTRFVPVTRYQGMMYFTVYASEVRNHSCTMYLKKKNGGKISESCFLAPQIIV